MGQNLLAQKRSRANFKSLRIKLAINEFELHPDRLSTSDENGRRIFLYPADVKGFFRRKRTQVQFVLVLLFLGLPWVKIQGRQALLLNIAERKFEIFGLSLRAHNAPLLLLVFSTGAFALFFVTTVFGRVWCGWACPQTVFIDGIFRRIERWVEGPALERRKLNKEPISFRKVSKRSFKWLLYTLATLIITHSFLAYFIGTEHLSQMMQESPSKNWGNFLFMAISTAIVLFDFAWFREQFCTIVCPYGRFQSVLMDKGSLIVSYDRERGEPRATPQAKVLSKTHNSRLGDCVNCYRCVQVCPTGIDIRRGLQMECIACTGCIDACNDVMTKLKKPTGLIRYDSLLGKTKKKRFFTLRSSLYLSVCLGSIILLIILLSLLKPIDVDILRAKDSPYTVQTNPDASVSVVNHFKVELSNQSGINHNLVFVVAPDVRHGDSEIQIITAQQPLSVTDGNVTQADVFVRFPKSFLKNGQEKIRMLIRDQNVSADRVIEIEKEVTLVGPFS